MIRLLVTVAMVSFLLGSQPVRAEEHYGYDMNYGQGERHNCRGLEGPDKKACIHQVKKDHAARYRERKMMERQTEIKNDTKERRVE